MESGFDTYMNSGYNFDRLPKKTLLVRWHSSATDQTTIDLSLTEPLKIDVLSDIYLDNFTTFHNSSTSVSFNTPAKSAFVLNINEFNTKTNIAGKGNDKRKDIFKPNSHKSLHDIIDISSGGNHTFVKTINNEIYTFGNNHYSQLGIEILDELKLTPIQVFKDKDEIWASNIRRSKQKSARK